MTNRSTRTPITLYPPVLLRLWDGVDNRKGFIAPTGLGRKHATVEPTASFPQASNLHRRNSSGLFHDEIGTQKLARRVRLFLYITPPKFNAPRGKHRSKFALDTCRCMYVISRRFTWLGSKSSKYLCSLVPPAHPAHD